MLVRVLAIEPLKECQEIVRRVPVNGPRGHFARVDAQGGDERDRSVTLVGCGQTSGSAFAQRKFRLGPVQRLDAGLLVYAQNQRVLRWIEIEADDIDHLGLELRIGRFPAPVLCFVRLQVGFAQYLMYGGLADPAGPGNAALTPRSRAVRGLGPSGLDDRRAHGSGNKQWTTGAWSVLEPVQPSLFKTAAPLIDGGTAHV